MQWLHITIALVPDPLPLEGAMCRPPSCRVCVQRVVHQDAGKLVYNLLNKDMQEGGQHMAGRQLVYRIRVNKVDLRDTSHMQESDNK